MIGTNETFNFGQNQGQIATFHGFDVLEQLNKQAYGLTFEVVKEHSILASALSDCSILCLDLNTMKSVCHIPDAHAKRINEVFWNENWLYTCSNDGSIKVWDVRSNNPLVGQCRGPSMQEFYSVSQVKHIVTGGGDPDIHFWDLRKFKLLNTFNETHSDEVTSLRFLQSKPSILMSSSLDGMVCLFDLSKESEEEATDTVVRLEQPVNSCKFLGDNFNTAFAQTTVQTIALLSLENAKMVKEVNTIDHLDTNEFALLGAYTIPGENSLYYLRGNLEGYMEEYSINLTEDVPSAHINKFYSHHKGPVTKAERISDQHIVSAGEDGKFCITENQKVDNNVFDFEQMKQNMFYEDDNTTDSSNNVQAQNKVEEPNSTTIPFNN